LVVLLVACACGGNPADDDAVATTAATASSSTTVTTSTAPHAAVWLPTYHAGSWRELGALVVDDGSLEAAFADAGYQLPVGSEVLLVEIVDGVDQPAYMLYEAGQGAFSTDFYPASTVKLLTAVGALEYLGELGFTGAAEVQFDDGFTATVASLYESALVESSNESYDRLVQMAGLSYLNDVFLAGYGFDSFVFRYSMTMLNLEYPPGYVLTERVADGADAGSEYHIVEIEGITPVGPTTTTTVPSFENRNDTDLFDLVDGLRRVVLADEIPAEERFDITDTDLEGLQDGLAAAYPSFFEDGIRWTLGDDAVIWHKAGWMPGAECLDHAYVEDPSSGRRFLLAATVSYDDCSGLATVASQVFGAADRLEPGVPLQAGAGVEVGLGLWVEGGQLLVDLNTSADSGRFYVDDTLVLEVSGTGVGDEVRIDLPEPGHHVLFVILYSGGDPVSYRSVGFTVAAA
jgi:hypothetical protein